MPCRAQHWSSLVPPGRGPRIPRRAATSPAARSTRPCSARTAWSTAIIQPKWLQTANGLGASYRYLSPGFRRRGVPDMGLRIGPVRISKRGVRVGIGPRIARVHVGAGRPGISSGVGPVSVYKGTGGRRRSRPPVRRPAPYGAVRAVSAQPRPTAPPRAPKAPRRPRMSLPVWLTLLVSITASMLWASAAGADKGPDIVLVLAVAAFVIWRRVRSTRYWRDQG
jgi:hypothetical protein